MSPRSRNMCGFAGTCARRFSLSVSVHANFSERLCVAKKQRLQHNCEHCKQRRVNDRCLFRPPVKKKGNSRARVSEIVFEPRAIYRWGKWIHYSTPYVVLALIKAGLSLSSKEVSLGINAICRDQEENTGGWKILKEYPPFTHATAHALIAVRNS